MAGRRSGRREAGPLRRLAEPLRSAEYRRLWTSQVLSEVGDWAARLALSALVYGRSGSAALGSLAFVAGLLPALGPGQWLATYADRYGRRVVMVSCDLARAAIFGVLALPLDWPTAVPLLLALLAGVATTPFESARAAAVIDVSERGSGEGTHRQVVDAVTLGQLTQDLATLLGYLVGGALLVGLGPAAGLAVDAATFALSAALLGTLPPMVPQLDPGEQQLGPLSRLRAAGSALIADPLVRRAALLASLAVATGTATQSLVVPLVTTGLPGHGWLSGVALAAGAGAALLVTLALPRRAGGARAVRLTAGLCVAPALLGAAPGLLGVALGTAPAAGSVLVGVVATGGLFAALVPAVGLVAPRLPAALRASCFGLLTAVLTAMQGVLCLAAGLLADLLGPAAATAAVLGPVTAAGAFVLLRPGAEQVHHAAAGRRHALGVVAPTDRVVWTPPARHRIRSAVHGRSGWPLALSRPAPQLYRLNGPALVVRGRPSQPGPGAVLGVAFWVELRPSTRQVLSHLIDPHAGVHRRSTVTGGLSVEAFEAAGVQDGRRALDAAIAVAARLLGEPATLTGTGCLVDDVEGPGDRVVDLAGSGDLLPGDVIVRTARGRTETAGGLRLMLPDDGPATLGVRRAGVPGELEVRRERRDDGSWGFRASTHRQLLSCALDVALDLPDSTVGPSLGLAVTLGLLDLLGHRGPAGVTGGLNVAATGAVLPDGRVVAVGGLLAKARAVACHRGVQVFLVPAGNRAELAAVRRALRGRQVLPVATVEQALSHLAALTGGT